MTLEARYELFGETSDLLVQEAVWSCHECDGQWPSTSGVVEKLTDFADVQSEADAGDRLVQAFRDGEIVLGLDDDGSWIVQLRQEDYDAITRRYIDRTMPRADVKERF